MMIFVLKYWREIIIGIAVVLLLSAAMYIKSVFTELNRLQQENAILTARLKDAAAMQEMQNKIADAISQIRIRSNINVSRIETNPKPVFTTADPVVFIPGGMLQAVYSSGSAAGASSGHAPDHDLSSASRKSGILSR